MLTTDIHPWRLQILTHVSDYAHDATFLLFSKKNE